MGYGRTYFICYNIKCGMIGACDSWWRNKITGQICGYCCLDEIEISKDGKCLMATKEDFNYFQEKLEEFNKLENG